MTIIEYYVKYLMPSTESDICPYCKVRQKQFKNVAAGFRLSCNDAACLYALRSELQHDCQNRDEVKQHKRELHATPEFKLKHRAATKAAMWRTDVRTRQLNGLHTEATHDKLSNISDAKRNKLSSIARQMHLDGKFDNVKYASYGTAHYKIVNSELCLSHATKIWVRSLDEAACIDFLEALHLQYYYEHTKIMFVYDNDSMHVQHVYKVDFSVVLPSNKLLLIECKPSNRCKDYEVLQKQAAAMQFVDKHKDMYAAYIMLHDAKYKTVQQFEQLIHEYLS